VSATKEALSILRFIYRKPASRAGKFALLFLLATPLATWCTLRVCMALTVRRASTLLLKIKRLRARESTFDDAMRLAHEYAGEVDYGDELCNPRN
jgi:hypothetical protein